LSKKKFYLDPIDGRPGSLTRRAIGLYQSAAGIPIDCWPSKKVLDHLRSSNLENKSGP
jgi:peptidoglycan hydrolase-like protein with peptidoglycan-binding domain